MSSKNPTSPLPVVSLDTQSPMLRSATSPNLVGLANLEIDDHESTNALYRSLISPTTAPLTSSKGSWQPHALLRSRWLLQRSYSWPPVMSVSIKDARDARTILPAEKLEEAEFPSSIVHVFDLDMSESSDEPSSEEDVAEEFDVPPSGVIRALSPRTKETLFELKKSTSSSSLRATRTSPVRSSIGEKKEGFRSSVRRRWNQFLHKQKERPLQLLRHPPIPPFHQHDQKALEPLKGSLVETRTTSGKEDTKFPDRYVTTTTKTSPSPARKPAPPKSPPDKPSPRKSTRSPSGRPSTLKPSSSKKSRSKSSSRKKDHKGSRESEEKRKRNRENAKKPRTHTSPRSRSKAGVQHPPHELSRAKPTFEADGSFRQSGEPPLWDSHGKHHSRARTASGHRHVWREPSVDIFTVKEESDHFVTMPQRADESFILAEEQARGRPRGETRPVL